MPVMHAHCLMMSGATGYEAMHARMMQQHMGASSMPFDLTHPSHIFTPLPSGGRIIYSTSRPELVRAIHRWLKAQAQDHTNDATLSHQ